MPLLTYLFTFDLEYPSFFYTLPTGIWKLVFKTKTESVSKNAWQQCNSMNISTDSMAFHTVFSLSSQPPSPTPRTSLWLAGISRGVQVFVVWQKMSLCEAAPGMKNPPLVTSLNRSWVRWNECFHSAEMRWRVRMTAGLGGPGWGCLSTTRRQEETPRGRMNGQTDEHKDGWKEGVWEVHSYLFFWCLPPFRETFKAVLPMYIFFMVCLCSLPLMCYRGWPQGTGMCVSFPMETS